MVKSNFKNKYRKLIKQVSLKDLIDIDIKSLPYEINALEIKDITELKENIPLFLRILRSSDYSCVIRSNDINIAKTLEMLNVQQEGRLNFYLINPTEEQLNIDPDSFKNINFVIEHNIKSYSKTFQIKSHILNNI